MPTTLRINGLALYFDFDPENPVRLLDVTTLPYSRKLDPEQRLLKWARLVEIQASGLDQDDHHGNKYTGTLPGGLLRYESHSRSRTTLGPKLEIRQVGGGLTVTSHLQFLGKLPAFRSWTVVLNSGKAPILLEYVSTFALAGISREGTQPWARKMRLHLADNAWCGECQWRSGRLPDFGLNPVYPPTGGSGFGLGRVSIASQGTWSTQGYLPMGALENTETGETHFWQIEHNGSWHWEVGDLARELYLRLAGPTWREGHWSRHLQPGDSFETVPATFGRVTGSIQEALRTLTQVRRWIRRPHRDMEELPVIFNDYMNCLFGDPTTEQLQPVIAAAAAVGSEYFVIDAGWYAERGRSWWDTVGEWEPSATRFPGGLKEVTDSIRNSGMIPGLWLEIEVMGVNCPLAAQLPDSWFFQRAGRRVIDHGRYQFDFRNPEVCAHAHAVVDRLVRDFGIGYLKMDYNINAGPGTDFEADSLGHGLLGHNRGYLDWVRAVFDRHPELVIENCSSGGLRMDYAQLSVHSIQSTSDQTDYRITGLITAACASAVTPEQAAAWTYPLKEGNEEETIFNMVNALLLRVHQSGRLHEISARRLERVREGIDVYKGIRSDIAKGLPFWPLGLPRIGDGWASFGLDCGAVSYLAVWRLDSKQRTQALPLPQWKGQKIAVRLLYPEGVKAPLKWSGASGILKVELARNNTARLFVIRR